MAVVNYTKIVNGKVSPSCTVATLVSGTESRMFCTVDVFPTLKAMFHRQFAANCVHFSELSWWLDRNNLLILRWYNIMKTCDVCHCV
jgi:hypothetical protein